MSSASSAGSRQASSNQGTIPSDGQPVRALTFADEERTLVRTLHLLTAKPVLYVCNVDEQSARAGNELSAEVVRRAAREGAEAVIVSAAIEAEIAAFEDAAEKRAFLEDLGLETAGLERVIHAGHQLLGLIRFLTASPKEARAWTIRRGDTARDAAGGTDVQAYLVDFVGYQGHVHLSATVPTEHGVIQPVSTARIAQVLCLDGGRR